MNRGRVDRRQQVAPHVPMWVRESVHDVARYLQCSDGSAASRMALAASQSVLVVNDLAPYFWRDYSRGDVAWIGHHKPADFRELLPTRYERVERLKLRISHDDWWELDAIAFALAWPLGPVVGVLVTQAAVREVVLESAAPGFVPRSPFSLKRGTVQWGG